MFFKNCRACGIGFRTDAMWKALCDFCIEQRFIIKVNRFEVWR